MHYTIAILESAKPLLLNKETTFTFKQSDEKQRAKIWKEKKNKRKKEEEGKGSVVARRTKGGWRQRERTERRKRRMQSPSP